MTGKMYSEFWGVSSALMVVFGFNLTFFVQFLMGAQGMPRRYYHYLDQFTIYHQISTVGSYVLGFGFLMAIMTLLVSLKNGKAAPKNPWHAASLEWTHTDEVPITTNFREQPVVMEGPYEYR